VCGMAADQRCDRMRLNATSGQGYIQSRVVAFRFSAEFNLSLGMIESLR
jgi:hypothetical protein